MVALPPRRLIREGVPVAAILLFWNLLAGIAHFQNVGGTVGDAGVIMAALYVVVRGVSLSSEVFPPVTGDVEAVLYENARLAVPAGVWFVGAMAVGALEAHIHEFTWIISSVKMALAGGGLGVVTLYAVAAGYRTFSGGKTTDSDPPAGPGAADDREAAGDGTVADDEIPPSDETDGASADD